MKILNIGVGIIYKPSKDPSILFIKREKPPYKGYLALPGGKIKYGEPLNLGMQRELKEETGIEIDESSLIAIVNEFFHDQENYLAGHFILYYFSSQIKGDPELSHSDEGEVLWLRYSEVLNQKQKIVPSDFNIVKEVQFGSSHDIDNISYFECTLKITNDTKDAINASIAEPLELVEWEIQ